jgi:hypothetical protein
VKHAELDAPVAAFLEQNPTALPSTTPILKLLEWSARRVHAATCSRCGVFLSVVRVEMGIERCSDCDGRR